jgi:hypothetical protein
MSNPTSSTHAQQSKGDTTQPFDKNPSLTARLRTVGLYDHAGNQSLEQLSDMGLCFVDQDGKVCTPSSDCETCPMGIASIPHPFFHPESGITHTDGTTVSQMEQAGMSELRTKIDSLFDPNDVVVMAYRGERPGEQAPQIVLWSDAGKTFHRAHHAHGPDTTHLSANTQLIGYENQWGNKGNQMSRAVLFQDRDNEVWSIPDTGVRISAAQDGTAYLDWQEDNGLGDLPKGPWNVKKVHQSKIPIGEGRGSWRVVELDATSSLQPKLAGF